MFHSFIKLKEDWGRWARMPRPGPLQRCNVTDQIVSHLPETSLLLVVISSSNTVSFDTYQFILVLYWTPSQFRSNFYDWHQTAWETGTQATLPWSVSSSDWIDIFLQDLLNQWKLKIAIAFLRLASAFGVSGSKGLGYVPLGWFRSGSMIQDH